MKKLAFLGLIVVMLLPLLVTGCVTGEPVTVELTLDDFVANNDIVLNYDLNPQVTLIVKLGTNPTTGFDWEEAVIANSAIIEQVFRDYLEPTSGLMGAPGTTIFEFKAKSDGTTTIEFKYSRPWESVPAAYSLTINITVD